jgi:hypothetical protein
MRAFIHGLFRASRAQYSSQSITGKRALLLNMSNGTALAALFTASITDGKKSGTPEEYASKPHHLKGGKVFTNPWESWRELKPLNIMKYFVVYVSISGIL